jgi:transcriptional regulator with XRE-family HTH domain
MKGGMFMKQSRTRLIRRQKDISGIKIAEMLGISAQYYYDIEKGKRNLSAEMAARLAEIFGVTTDYLLGRTDTSQEIKTFNQIIGIDKEALDLAKEIQKLNSRDRELLKIMVKAMRKYEKKE